MNKLVSKNSVQRFKQGNQIIKAEEGTVAKWQRRIKHPIDAYNNLDKRIPNPFVWMDNQLKKIGNSLVVEDYTPENGGTINNKIREQRNKQKTTTTSEKSISKKLENQELVKKAWNKLEEDAINKRGIYKPKSNTRSSITTTPRFLSKYANMANTIGGANNIKAWQQKLEKFYTPGTYNPDSIWGDNTQAAYERYLATQFKTPTISSGEDITGLEKAREITPNKQTISSEQNDFALQKSANYPTTYEITYSNPYVKELFDKVVLRNPVRYTPYYNSNLSYYTPSRFVTFSKEGSKLIFRNPIQRFKSINFRKVAQ